MFMAKESRNISRKNRTEKRRKMKWEKKRTSTEIIDVSNFFCEENLFIILKR